MATVDHLLFALKLFAALGCGLIAGVFFAFSTFVMKALAQQPPAQGIAAMQFINITVINPLFMTAFLGTGAACILLAVSLLFKWHQPGAAYLLAPRQPALSERHSFGDARVQCAAEQCAGDRQTRQH